MRVFKFLSLFLLVFSVGTGGYVWLEGWSVFDAFYMTIVTLTTTGFSETHPLSDQGRIFTMVLMLGGISLFTYGIQQLIASRFEFARLRRRKMKDQIRKLRDHAILCGYGRMGKVIAQELYEHEYPFVIIESDEKAREELKLSPYLYTIGDAADDNELIDLNIESARTIIIMIEKDADILYTLMAAKNINPAIEAICRASDEQAKFRLKRTGADRIVQPLQASASKVANLVLNPAAESLLDWSDVVREGEDDFCMVEFNVYSGSKYDGLALDHAPKITSNKDFLLVGILDSESRFHFKPESHIRLNAQDKVVGLCNVKAISTLQQDFKAT